MSGGNLVLEECGDILVLQSEIISRIQHELYKKRNLIDEEDVMKVKRELVEEKSEHEKTQLQLSLTREKIQILESEAQILAKQLDREKQTFENALVTN
jgi:hypothetical protein